MVFELFKIGCCRFLPEAKPLYRIQFEQLHDEVLSVLIQIFWHIVSASLDLCIELELITAIER